MHRNTRIPSQPESPTYDPSNSPSRSGTAHPPVRRNLFSAHLSRRPVSSQSQSQSPSQPQSPTHPQPQSLSQGHRPDLQPRTVSQNSPFASPPHLPPAQLHPSFADSYDPTISPNHPLSPGTSATLFPSNSIVAVHPVTGRPLLPTLPTLPSRLRLSDDEGEEDEEDEDVEDTHDDEHEHGHTEHNHTHNDPFAPTKRSQHTGPTGGYQNAAAASFLTDPQEDEADLARHERERFDNLVNDLMTRYRSRQSHHHTSSHSSQGVTHSHSLRAKGKVPAHPRAVKGDEELDMEAQEEKDELMGHLMAKLRQEVVRAEEEGWMFGDFTGGDGGMEGGEGMDGEGGGGYGYTYGSGAGVGVNAGAALGVGAGGGGGVEVPGREEVVAYE